MIYANNGSGKTTLALLFRSLNGNNDIVNKKSFDSKVAPEIKLLEEGNIKINFSKGKWSKFISNIEIFDSFTLMTIFTLLP
ncbi:MAG: hypothetical protein IPH42_11000 [Bacteroidetes bacterium]|nr:hypothetical protein [Bacteroidota bacterium]